MIKETSRRKNSSLSRKRTSSNATNIVADSAKENIFSRKSFARKNNLFNKNFFLWENVPSTWLWHLLVTITSVWTKFVGSLEKSFASLKWTNFLKTFVCLWDEKKIILRESRKLFARLAQNVALEKIFFCAVSENVCCVWWCSFARQARIFSAWGFFYHLFKRKCFELAALNFCAYVFKDLRVRLFLFERVALSLCAHSCAASAHHRCELFDVEKPFEADLKYAHISQYFLESFDLCFA